MTRRSRDRNERRDVISERFFFSSLPPIPRSLRESMTLSSRAEREISGFYRA